MPRAPEVQGASFNQPPSPRSSSPRGRASLAAAALAGLLAAGCLRQWPVYAPPVWAPDGSRVFYALVRLDGAPAVRRVDLVTGEMEEAAARRLGHPLLALALAPAADAVAVLVHKPGAKLLELRLAGLRGGAERAVWTTPATADGARDLAWTPDGAALVLATGPELWLVDAQGRRPRRLYQAAAVRAPAVSPDGQWVAFLARPEPQAPWSVYLASLDGTRRTVAARAAATAYRPGYAPAWAPDGAALAYVAERSLAAGFAELWVWERATGRRRLLARTLAGACVAPAWAPDGAEVAFVRFPVGMGPGPAGREGRPAEIALVEAEGGEPRTLVADGLANLAPAWAPDGESLAFATCAQPGPTPHVLRLVTRDGGEPRLLRDVPSERFVLAWARLARGNPRAAPRAEAELESIEPPWAAAQARLLLARHHAETGRPAKAAEHARRAAAADRPDARRAALRVLAAARMRLGEPRRALEAARRLEALGADGADRLVARLERGIEALADASRTSPDSPRALLRQAEAHRALLGNPRKAVELALRVLDQAPGGAAARRAAGLLLDAYAELGPGAASYRVLQRAARALGEEGLSPARILLLAQAAARSGQPDAALEWLDGLEEAGAPPQTPGVAAVCLRAGKLLLAAGERERALAAFRRGARGDGGPAAARNALGAAEALAEGGQHVEAARCLLRVFRSRPGPATFRGALRLLTRARLGRADAVAYDAARVGQLAACGFVEAAAELGRQLLGGLPPGDPRRELVARPLADACDRLVGLRIARGELGQARAVAAEWVRRARPEHDLAPALARLAQCHRLGGQRQALIATLARLVLECPHSPHAAAARQELLLLQAPPSRAPR
ncbi:MAG: hypothetical protein ACLF0G_08170 [Candidatus Brocadiia bacterium]